jgi:hypothetical protein
MDKRIMTVMVLAALGGCAPSVAWVKPDAAAQQAAADEKQCDGIAAREASEEMMSSHSLYPPETDTLYALSGGNISGHGPKASYSREGARAYEIASYCMQQRGYTLVPVAPKPQG